MAAISLSSDELRDAVAVNIDQGEGVRLRKRFVNRVAYPFAVGWGASLLEPVQAIAMSLAVDEIKLAVVIDVIAEDGEAGVAEFPFSMPLPFVVVGIDLLKPAVRREHVRFAIAVDVGDADAVAILFSAAQVVNPRLVFTKVGPQDT